LIQTWAYFNIDIYNIKVEIYLNISYDYFINFYFYFMQTTPLYMPEDHMDDLYNSNNFLVKYVHLNRLENIVKTMPNKDGLNVLDAGCGEGHLLELLIKKNSNNNYYGIDLTAEALKKAKERCPKAKFVQADLSNIDIEDNFFDFIVCTETLEHVDAYQDVINEFKRILKPGGYLVITFPNEFWWTVSRFLLGRRPIKVPDHINSFSPNSMKKYVNLFSEKDMGLPFAWSFWISLGHLIKFKK